MTFNCAKCGRRLRKARDGSRRWVVSKHTGKRYCWPGTGCQRGEK